MNETTRVPAKSDERKARSAEVAALQALKDQNFQEISGASIDELIHFAMQRVIALDLLLEAEKAFGDEAEGAQDRIGKAEGDCVRAREIFLKIQYPEDARFDVRREVLQADINRAVTLRAALQRWREIDSRIVALNSRLNSFFEKVDEKNKSLAEAHHRAEKQIEQEKEILLKEFDSLREAAGTRQRELGDNIRAAARSVGDLAGEVNRLSAISLAAEAMIVSRGKDLEEWREFWDEVRRIYEQFGGQQSLSPGSEIGLESLSVLRQRLSATWQGIAGSVIDNLRGHFRAAKQAQIDEVQWRAFTDLVCGFPHEIQEVIEIGHSSEAVVGAAESLVERAESVIANWSEVRPSPLKSGAQRLLESMRSQRRAALVSQVGRKLGDARYWVTLGEEYLVSPAEADKAVGGPVDSGLRDEALGMEEPPAALLCIARAESLLGGIDRKSDAPELPEDLVREDRELRGSLSEIREKAMLCLPRWLARQRSLRLRVIAEELMSKQREVSSSEDLDATSILLGETKVRELLDEMIADSHLIGDAGLEPSDEQTVRRLLRTRRENVERARTLVSEVEELRPKGKSELYQCWKKSEEAARLDPDSMSIVKLREECEEKWKELDGEFQKRVAACLPREVLDAEKVKLTRADVESRLREAREGLENARDFAGEYGGGPGVWKDEILCWTKSIEASEVLFRYTDFGWLQWKRERQVDALLEKSCNLVKSVDASSDCRRLMGVVLSLGKPTRKDRPSQAVRYAEVDRELGEPSLAVTAGRKTVDKIETIKTISEKWRNGDLTSPQSLLDQVNVHLEKADNTKLSVFSDLDRWYMKMKYGRYAAIGIGVGIMVAGLIYWWSVRQPSTSALVPPAAPAAATTTAPAAAIPTASVAAGTPAAVPATAPSQTTDLPRLH